MTYDEFLKTIVDRSQERLGKMYHVCIEKVLKNNGEKKDALCMRKEESTVEPVLYLNPYYDLYQEQMTLDDIMDEIMEVYKWNKDRPVGWNHDFADFEGIRNRIIFKLVNAGKNKELLSSAPHILYMDLAIVFYIYKAKSVYRLKTVGLDHANGN